MARKKKGAVKTRYSDAELQEFKALIEEKLDSARKELLYLQTQIKNSAEEMSEGKVYNLEDGTSTFEKEQLNTMASRQTQYIHHLENALIRINNQTYGVCRETGKLIQKERLMIVPHATLSIEAKNAQK